MSEVSVPGVAVAAGAAWSSGGNAVHAVRARSAARPTLIERGALREAGVTVHTYQCGVTRSNRGRGTREDAVTDTSNAVYRRVTIGHYKKIAPDLPVEGHVRALRRIWG